jgi:hypothetical protein
MAVVVLPTPPFWLATAMVRGNGRTNALCTVGDTEDVFTRFLCDLRRGLAGAEGSIGERRIRETRTEIAAEAYGRSLVRLRTSCHALASPWCDSPAFPRLFGVEPASAMFHVKHHNGCRTEHGAARFGTTRKRAPCATDVSRETSKLPSGEPHVVTSIHRPASL